MDTVSCDDDVFKDGTSLGFFDMSKSEAQDFCEKKTAETGYKHDWHYMAGRVHIKALVPTEKTELRQQLAAMTERAGMLQISLDAKKILLESCETALSDTQAKLEAAELEVERRRDCVVVEEELRGNMRDELWAELDSSRETMTEALRAAVSATKKSILERIDSKALTQEGDTDEE